jgi:hypothetical protein
MIITTKINKHVNNTSNFLYLCRKLKIIYTKWIVVLTIKENYLESIRKAGFKYPQILEEKLYDDEDRVDGRKITSVTIRATK